MRYISVVILLVFAIFAVSKASPSPALFDPARFDIRNKLSKLGDDIVSLKDNVLAKTNETNANTPFVNVTEAVVDDVSKTTPKPVEPNTNSNNKNSSGFNFMGAFKKFGNNIVSLKDNVLAKTNKTFSKIASDAKSVIDKAKAPLVKVKKVVVDAVSKTTPKPVELNTDNSNKNSTGFDIKGTFSKLGDDIATFTNNAAQKTKEKFNQLKSETELAFESAKKQLAEGTKDLGKKAQQKLMDLAEQLLRFIENKLKDLSDGIDSQIKNQLENSKDKLIVSVDVHQRTITEMKSLLKANDTCTQNYNSQIDKLKDAAVNRLKECMEEELKSTKSIATGAKKTLIDLPRKVIGLTANILACINRPGFQCAKPIGDLVSTAYTLFSALEPFEVMLTGSLLKPLKTTTCVLNAQKIFEDETIALKAKILNCSSKK